MWLDFVPVSRTIYTQFLNNRNESRRHAADQTSDLFLLHLFDCLYSFERRKEEKSQVLTETIHSVRETCRITKEHDRDPIVPANETPTKLFFNGTVNLQKDFVKKFIFGLTFRSNEITQQLFLDMIEFGRSFSVPSGPIVHDSFS
jgi:hypothetical protein